MHSPSLSLLACALALLSGVTASPNNPSRANLALIRSLSTPSTAAAQGVHAIRSHSLLASMHKMHRRSKKANGLKRRADLAYVRCDSEYTWSLCGDGTCTPMGPVALGTICLNGAMATAPASSAPVAAPVAAPAPKPQAEAATVAPVASSQSGDTSPSSSSVEKSSSVADAPKQTAKAVLPVVVAAIVPSVAAIVSSVVIPTTPAPTPSPSPSPTPTPAPSSSPAVGGPFTGTGTFYNQEGGYGACGKQFTDSDYIVAIALSRYGTGSNNAPDCGRSVRITNKSNGKSVTARVEDACPGCDLRNDGGNSVDLSVAAFNAIADPATGVIPISWVFTS